MNSSWQGNRENERGIAHFYVNGLPTVSLEMNSFKEYDAVCKLVETEVKNRVASYAGALEGLAKSLRNADWIGS